MTGPTRVHAHRALPQSRAARAVGAVAAAIATTGGGHLLATGALPPLTGLLLAVVFLAVPAWWLAGHERGWERLATAQVAAQLGGHALFVATATDPIAHTGHHVIGPELVLLTHVAGAAVAGAWLRAGERRAAAAARRVVAALRHLIRSLLRTWHAARRPAPTRLESVPVRGVLAARLRHSIVHRGPQWWRRRPTRGSGGWQGGRPVPRGQLRRAGWPTSLVAVVLAVAIGWFAPLFGISLLAFLTIDVLLGRRARTSAHVSARGE
jgi:hypothetical protein